MHRVLVLAAPVLLTACTNDVVVTTSLQDGQIVFTAPSDRDAGRSCLDYASVSDGDGNVAWEIGDPTNGSRPCVPANPLRYGAAPIGVPTMRSAQPLVPGESYALTASPGSLRAAFRYNGPQTAPNDYQPGSAEWCAVQYRGSTPDWFGRCIVK